MRNIKAFLKSNYVKRRLSVSVFFLLITSVVFQLNTISNHRVDKPSRLNCFRLTKNAFKIKKKPLSKKGRKRISRLFKKAHCRKVISSFKQLLLLVSLCSIAFYLIRGFYSGLLSKFKSIGFIKDDISNWFYFFLGIGFKKDNVICLGKFLTNNKDAVLKYQTNLELFNETFNIPDDSKFRYQECSFNGSDYIFRMNHLAIETHTAKITNDRNFILGKSKNGLIKEDIFLAPCIIARAPSQFGKTFAVMEMIVKQLLLKKDVNQRIYIWTSKPTSTITSLKDDRVKIFKSEPDGVDTKVNKDFINIVNKEYNRASKLQSEMKEDKNMTYEFKDRVIVFIDEYTDLLKYKENKEWLINKVQKCGSSYITFVLASTDFIKESSVGLENIHYEFGNCLPTPSSFSNTNFKEKTLPRTIDLPKKQFYYIKKGDEAGYKIINPVKLKI